MKYEEIAKLIDAGFTADEIRKLTEEPEDETPAKEGGKSSSEEGGDPKAASPGDPPSDDNKEIRAFFTEIKSQISEQIEELKKAQQAINGKVYDTDNPFEKQLTAKDAFNQIYNPPMYFDDDEKGEK